MRRIVVMLAALATLLTLSSLCAVAQADTPSSPPPSPNVNLYYGMLYNQQTQKSYVGRSYTAYNSQENGYEPCSHCGQIVTVTVKGKYYFVVRPTSDETIVD